MADEPARRNAPQRTRPGAPKPEPPGWRVTPAPDGRAGRGPGGRPPRANGRWLVALLVLGLLVLNVWISSQALQPKARARIPYIPTFLGQLTSKTVSESSTPGDTTQ